MDYYNKIGSGPQVSDPGGAAGVADKDKRHNYKGVVDRDKIHIRNGTEAEGKWIGVGVGGREVCLDRMALLGSMMAQ